MRIAAWIYIVFVAVITLMAASALVAATLDVGVMGQLVIATLLALAVLLSATKVEISYPLLVLMGLAGVRVFDVAGFSVLVTYLVIAYVTLLLFRHLVATTATTVEVSLS